MKIFLTVLVLVLLVASFANGKRKGSKRQSIVARRSRLLKKSVPYTSITPGPTRNQTTTLSAQAVSTKAPPTIATFEPVNVVNPPPTKRILRTPHFTYVERKCCKLGFRAGRKGFSCDWDRYTAFRYTNMEHRMKMKFFGRKPSKRTQRFVKHVVNFCVKTGLKSLFHKCCRSAIK